MNAGTVGPDVALFRHHTALTTSRLSPLRTRERPTRQI